MSVLSLKKAQEVILFTWSKQLGLDRYTISKAKGIYFWDQRGKKYLDFSSQLVNINLGHSHPRLKRAVSIQLEKLDYATPSFISEPKVELAKQLTQITSLGKVFFTTGGGEANENAIIIARQVSGKDIIISRDPSYHGATYGARTASRDTTRNFPAKFDAPLFQYFPAPICSASEKQVHESCCLASLKQLEFLAKKHRGKIAAIILEVIPGAQGVLIPSKQYLPDLVNICKKNKIITIFDEVMTGFGRTGEWFAYQHWNVTPDIVTLSKGINSGMAPLGAVVVSKKIASYFDHNKLMAGLTNSGHPLSCAAAVEAIHVYEDENLIEKSAKLGHLLEKLSQKLVDKYPIVATTRTIGLFCGIEFIKQKSAFDPTLLVSEVSKEAFRSGLYLYSRLNLLLIAPPLVINKKELTWGIDTLERAIVNALSKFHINT